MATYDRLKSITIASRLMVTALAAVLTVVPLAGQERLLSQATFTNPLTGEKAQLSKHFDFSTGRIVTRTNNPALSSISQWDSLKAEKERKDFRKYGRIGPQLRTFVDNPSSFPDSGIEATVYLRMPFFKYLDKTSNSEAALRSQAEAIRNLKPVASVDQISQKYDISGSRLTSVSDAQFQVRLDRRLLDELREDEAVTVVEEFHKDEPVALSDYSPLDFRLIAWSAFNPSPLPAGCRGEGVNVATAEYGIWEHAFHCLGVNTPQVFIGSDAHSSECFACLVYSSPGANHYHTPKDNYGLREEDNRDYRMANNIRSMSESYAGSYPNNPRAQPMARMDEWIYEWPTYTLFCNPAGNGPPPTGDGINVTTNWSCYNHLNVGACRHINLSRYEVAGFTCTRNPTPLYGGPWIDGDSTRGDRELPHILTPGGSPMSDWQWYDNCLNSPPSAGTSYSAPVAVGLVADVISAGKSGPNPAFNNWPELVRATLMLTAQDCNGSPYQGTGADGRDGLGVASGYDATQFALHSTMYGGAPLEKGFHIASWRPDQTDPLPIYIKIPQNYPGDGRQLRVLLTWNSVTNADASPVINELSDLDLWWNNNGYVHSSTTWNNNVEVVEIPWAEVVPTSICSVTVNPYALRFPDSTKQDFFYYTVVWDWVLSSAPVVPEPSAPPDLGPYPDIQTPGVPQLISPPNGSVNNRATLTLSWGRVGLADSYLVQVLYGSTIVVDRLISNRDQTSASVVLNYNTPYTWRVGAANAYDTVWSTTDWFTTMPCVAIPATGTIGLIFTLCIISGISFRSFNRGRKDRSMKTLLLALLLPLSLFPVAHASDIKYAQAQGTLNEGNDYLAIFSVDYTDSLLEGGYLYEFSSAGIPDTMPLRKTWITGPLELGQVSFRFALQNDTEVFRGSVIWMSTGGHFTIPDTMFSAQFFSTSTHNVRIPNSFSRFDNNNISSEIDSICSNITFAWERISNLNLVDSLTARKHHVAFYLYPPNVGPFDPAYAKIIVFIYAARAADVSLLRAGHSTHEHVIRSEHSGTLQAYGRIYNVRGIRIPQGRIAPAPVIYVKDNGTLRFPPVHSIAVERIDP